MLTLFEAGFLSATDPAVKLPQVCYRLLSERFEMQITVRSKLWGHGRAGKAPAPHLCQNVVPPPFMGSQSVRIFRRPWIRDLGAPWSYPTPAWTCLACLAQISSTCGSSSRTSLSQTQHQWLKSTVSCNSGISLSSFVVTRG